MTKFLILCFVATLMLAQVSLADPVVSDETIAFGD
uniref:Venom peptide n=1 Tax=Comana monomorpha TaxID=1555636 RepID=A0AAU6PBH2_9NEOP